MARKQMTTLKTAMRSGCLEEFIKEHEKEPSGDLEKLDAVLKRPVRGTEKATPKASSRDASDD